MKLTIALLIATSMTVISPTVAMGEESVLGSAGTSDEGFDQLLQRVELQVTLQQYKKILELRQEAQVEFGLAKVEIEAAAPIKEETVSKVQERRLRAEAKEQLPEDQNQEIARHQLDALGARSESAGSGEKVGSTREQKLRIRSLTSRIEWLDEYAKKVARDARVLNAELFSRQQSELRARRFRSRE